jgi:hypothetical protein
MSVISKKYEHLTRRKIKYLGVGVSRVKDKLMLEEGDKSYNILSIKRKLCPKL